MTSSFCHLHLHTQFSLLDGANHIEPLLKRIKSFQQPAVAMTDHGNMFGAIEFYRKAKEIGVTPIIGCEAYMAPGSRHTKDSSKFAHNDYYHLILLAQNLTGYHNLIKLVSKGYLEGFYYKPRIDKELLKEHHEGVIALSGCLSGEIPYLIGQGDMAGARAVAGEFQDIFGPHNFYLEVQANGLDHQRIANRGLLELHHSLGIPLAGTNDCHYLGKDDARPHELMLCLQTGKTISNPDRMKFDTDQLYVKSTEEIAPAFVEFPGAVDNTCRIAESCDLQLPLNKTHLPQYRVPEGYTRESYVEQLAIEGLHARLRERPTSLPSDTYNLRLRHELTVICSMGFAGYFLIVWDIIRFARSRGIPVGPGRGSAAGSLVAYALRITDLDPLAYGLLFERFLNPDRVSLPDIDMDFCMDRRGEVINYVIEKYGADHVAQIITFGTLGAKAAVRDVGRVLELPYADVDRVAKLIPTQLNITLDQAIEQEVQLRESISANPQYQELFQIAKALEGLTRHASTHAAGVVISDLPLTEHVPLYKGANDEIVTQYQMGDIEKVGLVKFDFLGLKTLTMIQQAVTLIRQRPEGTSFSIDQIPFDDANTFRLLGSGKTTGVFQLESSGMRDLLTSLKPDRIDDLIAIIALYRPGPMDLIPDFIQRKQGKITIQYDLPQLEPILRTTYGVIVYQEQVMAIANVVAGFSLGQADLLRRAMGKKKPEEMAKLKTQFVDGSVKLGVAVDKAQHLYELIERFAGYGFNKSHAAAYAVISYQTAYLKANFPTEFMAALMTCDMGNLDKLMGYFNECRDLGFTVLGPDINQSDKPFTVVDNAIRFGLAGIKNVGEAAVDNILATRAEQGPFHSLFHVCERVDLRKVNKRVLESLIKTGAFDSTGASRPQLLAVLDQALKHGNTIQRHAEDHQIGFFDSAIDGTVAQPRQDPPLPHVADWSESERLQYERDLTGFYLSSHPLDQYRTTIHLYRTATTISLRDLHDGQLAKLCGLITQVKEIETKKKDKMAIVTLEDLEGTMEIVIFPDLYRTSKPLIKLEQVVRITGTVDHGEKRNTLKGTRLENLEPMRQQQIKGCAVLLREPHARHETLQALKTILEAHPGSTPVTLTILFDRHYQAHTNPLPALTIAITPQLLTQLEQLLGPQCYKLVAA